jgi:hypothetical protein
VTEVEWVACTDPGPMLEFLRGRASDRKLRLFAVACCRRVWHLVTDERSRQAVEVAEQFAEGHAKLRALNRAALLACVVPQDPSYAVAPPYSAVYAIEHARRSALSTAANPVNDAIIVTALVAGNAVAAGSCLGWDEDHGNWLGKTTRRKTDEQVVQVTLLRDIFGPLHLRPVTIQPHVLAWNDRLVVRMARSIYEERRWGELPLLGDALLDAGCDNEEMLSHAREQAGVHGRGCWLVDLLLNKE